MARACLSTDRGSTGAKLGIVHRYPGLGFLRRTLRRRRRQAQFYREIRSRPDFRTARRPTHRQPRASYAVAESRRRLVTLLQHAAKRPKKRRPTKPGAAAREKRLTLKKRRSEVKASRPRGYDD